MNKFREPEQAGQKTTEKKEKGGLAPANDAHVMRETSLDP